MSEQKNTAGGSATERGIDFQARVSAIVLTCLITEQPLSWIEDNPTIIPINCQAETGGSGDDIAFTSSNEKYFEIQVKRGFRKGDDLWDALIKLAKAIVSNDIDYGILVVCPDSSGTIKKDLAQDIIRMGQDRFDGIKDISVEFKSRLEDEGLNVSKVCSSLYIQTVNAIEGNNDAESLAKNMLERISDDVEKTWKILVDNSRRIIKIKGNLTFQSCNELFKNNGINVKSGNKTNIQLFNKAYQYNKNAYSEISILSIPKPIDLQDIWIPLEAAIVSDEENESLNLDSTVERYQSWYKERRHNDTIIDSFTFGKFVKKCVVIGGAGIGKTTLFRKLALDYSDEGYFVLFVKLSKLTDMLSDNRKGFEECLIDCAFDRKIQTDNISSLLENAVILADGLDECFKHQSEIIQYFSKLSKDYPESRILISTRPIGYKLGLISDWRRYELKPIDDNEFESAVEQLTSVISPKVSIDEAVLEQIKVAKISHLVKRSPLILSLIIVLVKRGIEANTNYASLYRQLFSLIESKDLKKEVFVDLPSRQLQEFLYLLGWIILRDGYQPLQELVRLCYEEWKEELPPQKFEAFKIIDDCIAYWVAKGIIEKVNDLTDETVLFIHKTLGEYAAAEYLKTQSIDVKEKFILSAFSDSQYSETLTFLSHLGLSSKILSLWNNSYSANNKHKDINIYDFILHAGIDYNSDEIENFIDLCWKITENSFSTDRYNSGAVICHIAKNAWVKVKPTVKHRLKSDDSWVRLVATTAMISSDDKIETSKLIDALDEFQIEFLNSKDIKRKKFRVLLNFDGQKEVKKLLILAVVDKILIENDSNALTDLEEALLKISSYLNIGLLKDIQKAYKSKDIIVPTSLSMWPSKSKEGLPSYMNSMLELAEVLKEHAKNRMQFLEMIQDSSIKINIADYKRSDIELGALISVSNLWEFPADQGYFFINDTNKEEIIILLKLLADYGGIDYKIANYHVKKLLQRASLESEESNSGTDMLLDLPAVDIEGRDEYEIDDSHLSMLENLLLSQYHFLCFNALQLIATSKNEDKIIKIFSRVIEHGEGLTLHYAGHLNQCINDKKLVQDIICRKLLDNKNVDGLEHLYHFVDKPYSDKHISIIKKALNSTNPTTAIEATKLLDRIPLNLISLDKVKEFYLSWQDKEEPYPVKGGTVPHTPREKLAKILIKHHCHDESFIQQMMLDTRPDIRKQAIQPFVDYCKDSSHLKQWLVDKIKSEELEADLLKKCINEDVFLKDSHLVLELLNSESIDIREGALGILDTKYLPEIELKAHAKKLLNDEAIEIRQFAKKILDT